MSQAASTATANSGGVSLGGDTPPWLVTALAITISLLVVAGFAWLINRKK
jgi:hypothetical protein